MFPHHPFFDTNLFNWVILPSLIFIARVCDVSIGTIRSMFTNRGRIYLAPILGFFEMLIWLLAVRQVMFSLTNWVCYFAFAAGYALGNFTGIYLEEKLAMGMRVLRIITGKDPTELINGLKEAGYGVTIVDARGSVGKVNLIFSIIQRRDQDKVLSLVRKFNPNAFYSLEDIRAVGQGVFPNSKINQDINSVSR